MKYYILLALFLLSGIIHAQNTYKLPKNNTGKKQKRKGGIILKQIEQQNQIVQLPIIIPPVEILSYLVTKQFTQAHEEGNTITIVKERKRI